MSNAERVAEVLRRSFRAMRPRSTELIDRMAEATSALTSEDTVIVMTGGPRQPA